MKKPSEFMIHLEYVNVTENRHAFRVTFEGAESRILLPYPQITGLRIFNADETTELEWKTSMLISAPLDDFVLQPELRIAFDLQVLVEQDGMSQYSWSIQLPAGQLRARYRYHVDDQRDWYDFLAKRSRFASVTKPWNGTIESNTIELEHHRS